MGTGDLGDSEQRLSVPGVRSAKSGRAGERGVGWSRAGGEDAERGDSDPRRPGPSPRKGPRER